MPSLGLTRAPSILGLMRRFLTELSVMIAYTTTWISSQQIPMMAPEATLKDESFHVILSDRRFCRG